MQAVRISLTALLVPVAAAVQMAAVALERPILRLNTQERLAVPASRLEIKLELRAVAEARLIPVAQRRPMAQAAVEAEILELRLRRVLVLPAALVPNGTVRMVQGVAVEAAAETMPVPGIQERAVLVDYMAAAAAPRGFLLVAEPIRSLVRGAKVLPSSSTHRQAEHLPGASMKKVVLFLVVPQQRRYKVYAPMTFPRFRYGKMPGGKFRHPRRGVQHLA